MSRMKKKPDWRTRWLRKVMHDTSLTTTTRLVASALAVEFCNFETGNLYPKVATACECLGISFASAKRAISALVDAGWLDRTEGRGAAKKTSYSLLVQGRVLSPKDDEEEPEKGRVKGSNTSLYEGGKSSVVSFKKLTGEPSYNKE